jgi:tetratricopeptide (TPR) repeat protein
MRSEREAYGIDWVFLLRSPWFLGVLLLALTVLAYLPALRAGFVWDDEEYVVNNPNLATAAGLVRTWSDPLASPQYYPMVFTTFWLEHQLWGLRASRYHAVNVLLHGLNALWVWRLLRRLDVPGAWAAAAVFAVHPVQVESVAWIAERKNVLSTFFYLTSLEAYLRFEPLGVTEASGPKQRAWKWYGVSLVLFVCALLSKTVTCSLPAVLLLLRWWRRGRVGRRDALPLAPFFAAGLALGLQTAWLEKHHVGASGVDWRLSPVDRCLIAGRALWFYAGKLAWPANLSFIYPRWSVDAGAWRQYAFPLGAVAVVAALWVGRRRIGRGPFVAVTFFIVTLSPALGFFDIYPMRYSFVADHFQYLAALGLITLAAALHALAARRLPAACRWLGPLTVAVLVSTLGAATAGRCRVYETPRALWADAVRKDPDCWMAHTHLGEILLREGRFREGEVHYAAAVRQNPRCAEAQVNLAFVLQDRGALREAADHLRTAETLSPALWQTPFTLGLVEEQLGDYDAAIGHLREALRESPRFADAHASLAACLIRSGKPEEARGHYAFVDSYLASSPSLLPASARIFDRAATALAVEADPKARDAPLAIAMALKICALTRSSKGLEPPAFLDTLAAAYSEAGEFDRAAAVARRALILASLEDAPGLSARIRRRLDAYEGRRPAHQVR